MPRMRLTPGAASVSATGQRPFVAYLFFPGHCKTIDGARANAPSFAAKFPMNWSLSTARVTAPSAKSLAKSASTCAWETPGEAQSVVATECRSAHERRVLGDRHRGRTGGRAA